MSACAFPPMGTPGGRLLLRTRSLLSSPVTVRCLPMSSDDTGLGVSMDGGILRTERLFTFALYTARARGLNPYPSPLRAGPCSLTMMPTAAFTDSALCRALWHLRQRRVRFAWWL